MDNNEKLEVALKKNVGTVQIKNQQDYSGDVKIVKVLTLSAKPNLETTTIFAGKVILEGEIDYDLLVVLEDNEITPLTQKAKFSQVFENSEISENSAICADLLLSELNSSGGGDESLHLSSTIEFNINIISKNCEVRNAVMPEGVFVRECEVCFNSLVTDVKYDGVINFELSKDSKIAKILFVKNSATIKSVISAVDYFVVSGTVFSSIIYETEDKSIRSIVKENNFSEEIEAKGTTKESNIQALIFTKEAVSTENSDKNMFVFDVPIAISAQVYNKNCTKTVIDAYSLKNEVNLTTESFSVGEFASTKQADENILTNFTLSESIPQIDKLLATTPTYITILNQIVKNSEVVLEGLANINLIYYSEDADGNNVLNSLDVEVPYSISLKLAEISESDQIVSQAVLGDISVKVKHGRELEIFAEVKVDISQTSLSTSAITSQIALGEDKPERDYAMEIYLAKSSQTLWDIAKELNISTAELVEQNGELTLPLADEEKIVAYFRKESENN
ncbi:MAG: hypothetical protein EOM55_02190 [Clostridia bacterium]|nr:hypothetical protein [Clostridia bacterium]